MGKRNFLCADIEKDQYISTEPIYWHGQYIRSDLTKYLSYLYEIHWIDIVIYSFPSISIIRRYISYWDNADDNNRISLIKVTCLSNSVLIFKSLPWAPTVLFWGPGDTEKRTKGIILSRTAFTKGNYFAFEQSKCIVKKDTKSCGCFILGFENAQILVCEIFVKM